MSNPLYSMFGGMGAMPNNNMANMMRQFMQFRQNFHGDPRQQVQQLLNSGKVSQDQYNQAVRMANMFQQIMGGK